MTQEGPDIHHAARTLLGQVESDHGTRLPAAAFRAVNPAEPPTRVATIDGGQSVVAELGACGVLAIRAGFTLRATPEAHEDVVTTERIRVITRRRLREEWASLVAPFTWAASCESPIASGHQWVRAWCEAERGLAELDAAHRALRRLDVGDLLLLDGSLDGSPAVPSGLPSLLESACKAGVTVAAVSKDTSLTLQGTLPFTLELEEAAARLGDPHAFAADVTDACGGVGPHKTYGVRWDARAPVYRVDLRSADSDLDRWLGVLASLCNDVAFPGYPYPLARIHQRVAYAEHESGELRHRLEALVAERRGSLFSLRLFGRGRDVLTLGV